MTDQEDAVKLIKEAYDLKEQGNALFSLAKTESGEKASKLFYLAKAKYTKIRLYVDGLEPPNHVEFDLKSGSSTNSKVSKEQIEQIRKIRYQGDLNSCICSYRMAQHLTDTSKKRQELERAKFFADRAATPPPIKKPTEDNKLKEVVDVDRRKAVFWRGRLRAMVGDIDGADQDLRASLIAYANNSDSELLAVTVELKRLSILLDKHKLKERNLYANWLS